jgi:hypothetical protein
MGGARLRGAPGVSFENAGPDLVRARRSRAARRMPRVAVASHTARILVAHGDAARLGSRRTASAPRSVDVVPLFTSGDAMLRASGRAASAAASSSPSGRAPARVVKLGLRGPSSTVLPA